MTNPKLQFRKYVSSISEPRRSSLTGTVSGVRTDSEGRVVGAVVSIPGGSVVNASVIAGAAIYTGQSISIINVGSASRASWAVGSTMSFPSGVSGGIVASPGGGIISEFTKITVGTGNNVATIDGEDATWRIYSGHATPLSAPFRVNQEGEAWLTNAHVSGEITASSGTVGGWTIGATSLTDTAGTTGLSSAITGGDDIRFWAGHATPASAPFFVTEAGALTATTATITGTIYASAGSITGSLYVGAADPRIHIDGANKRIESTNFISGTSGFRIEGATGNAEFNDADIRGSLRVAIIHYGHILATNGSIWVTPAAGKTIAAFFTVDSPATFTISVEDPDGISHAAAGTLWVVDDIIRVQEPLTTGSIINVWAKVTAKTDKDSYWELSVVKQSPGAGTNYIFPAGATVLNYKQANAGLVRITADATYSPYISIATHAGEPWNTLTERARLGNLEGIGGLSSPGYGLWTDNGYFTGTITANAGYIGGPTGWAITTGKLTSVGIGLATAAGNLTYAFWAGDDAPADAEFSVTHAGALKSTSGTIGGWTLGSTSITGGDATLNSAGYLTLGTSNDIARIDASDATYRLWIGHATASSAPFSVTKAGVAKATSITATGSFSWDSGRADSNGLRISVVDDTIPESPSNPKMIRFVDGLTSESWLANWYVSKGADSGATSTMSVIASGEVLAQLTATSGDTKRSRYVASASDGTKYARVWRDVNVEGVAEARILSEAVGASRSASIYQSVFSTYSAIVLNSERLGFFNVTSIARPTTSYTSAIFSEEGGTNVNNTSLFDGYTLQQVVRAIRDLGLLT